MFIAEMPSNPLMAQGKRNFGITKRDRLLATVMKNNGVEGSYVTDIVKIKQQARMPDNNEVETFRPCLLKEIEIIQPRIIIVLGRRTYENSFKPYLEEEVSKSGIKIAWVFHYSSQVKTKKFVDKFNEVVGGMNFR
jgi:uracil-DNA glycosylase family 4